MSAVFSWLREFWANYGPWITVSLIPTLITGLSLSPQTAPAATAVQKAWDIVKKILDFVSVAKFKDTPGTFQLPLKMGKAVKVVKLKMGKKNLPPPSIGPGCAAVFALVLLTNTSACSWWHSDTMDNIKQAGIDCTIQSTMSSAASLLPVIMAVVTGHADNWKQQLSAIGKEFGRDVLACTLRQASIELTSDMASAASPEERGKVNNGITKSHEYIQEQKFTFKEQ